ncbi:ABC transporter substrate-binding protein (plasmid) [Halobaculum sp. CBA1158]|uniref:ABC transporter substrate-binding protein n=1 Tax=Halobaculum sp. CBA1158 TaxID=2904243 RepID=UPI001F37697E|nr:ABC transporter substrate-binding protein [Halobaculum sp. CBA1158]UIP01342.1 ABC transporter substrate-binding protein [Halobaculum sp. CBA1158]
MSKRITRRRTLAALGASGIAALAGCSGGGDGTETEGSTDTQADTEASDDMEGTTTGGSGGASGTVKIGVMQPISGDLQYYGQQALWGFSSGLAYKAGASPSVEAETGSQTVTVGDVDYELLIRDSQFSADTAQSLATNLVTNEDVDMLFGCASSGAANRVSETVAKQAGVPYMIGPAASASSTAESATCGEQIFRASENTAMDARSGGRYVARESDVSRVFLFGADYSFGRAVVNNYEAVLEAEGVEIVGKRFVPQGYSEWEGLLDNAAEAGAEGIVGGFTVATLPNLFTSYLNGDYDYTVFGGFATEITNNVVGGLLQNQLGEPLTEEKLAGAGIGPFTTRYHWNQYDNEINSAFVDGYVNAYGKVPDLFTSGTFTAASAIVQGVEGSGSTEGADIAAEMRGMTVADTPKGSDAYTFQEYNNQARSEMTVANVVPTADEWSDSWGAPVQPSEPVARIGADETTIPADDDGMNCSL